MRSIANFGLGASLLGMLVSCTLLIDRDGLTDARSSGTGGVHAGGAPTAGTGGANAEAGSGGVGAQAGAVSTGGSAASGTGGALGCSPAAADTACDGLNEACAATLTDAGCPAECVGVTLNGISYMACTISSTFDQAEVRCQAQRMHLVKIDSASENAFVVQLAEKLGSYVWIGGSNRSLTSTFAWLDGTAFYRDGVPIDGVYQNFGPGQPVDDALRACVQIHSDSQGHWLNTRCSDTLQFVCERY